MTKEKVIKSYKGFDKNMQCRGFQYKVGKEYEMDGNIKCCERGFHACESPMEVWNYYDMLNSRFAEVEQSGQIDKKDDGKSTKVCSSRIKIKAELKLADIIYIGVEWLKDITSPSKIKPNCLNDNGGGSARIGSSGDYARIGSSGYSARIGSSGYSAQIGSSGGYAQIDSTGEDSVIMCAGIDSTVKAKKGSWITLAEWVWDNEKKRKVPKCVRTEFVDGKRIKEDTWYQIKNGEFVVAENYND